MLSLPSLLRHACKPSSFTRSFHASNTSLQKKNRAGLHKGRVALVAASTSGCGYEMAKRLAEEGAHVVVSSRKQENIDKAVDSLKSEGLDVSGFACHVGNAQQRKDLVQHVAKAHGGIDILVNNAGVNAHSGPILETPESASDKAFEINVTAAFCLIKEAVPFMANRKTQGSVIVTSSGAAYMPHVFPGIYVVSKAAMLALPKAMMTDLLKHNIRINCVTLGLFETAFGEAITKNEELRERVIYEVAMKRIGKPEECAGLVSFLCSEDASYITGESFSVSGGSHSRL